MVENNCERIDHKTYKGTSEVTSQDITTHEQLQANTIHPEPILIRCHVPQQLAIRAPRWYGLLGAPAGAIHDQS